MLNKKKNNKSKNFFFNIIIIFIIILVMLKHIDFFKKLYFTLTRAHEVRLIKEYKFCGQESIGFLSFVKNNFNINYKIPIKNYEMSPNSSWYFGNLKKIKTNKVIFLNYTMQDQNFDNKKNNIFQHDLNSYKILYKYNNCYLLETND